MHLLIEAASFPGVMHLKQRQIKPIKIRHSRYHPAIIWRHKWLYWEKSITEPSYFHWLCCNGETESLRTSSKEESNSNPDINLSSTEIHLCTFILAEYMSWKVTCKSRSQNPCILPMSISKNVLVMEMTILELSIFTFSCSVTQSNSYYHQCYFFILAFLFLFFYSIISYILNYFFGLPSSICIYNPSQFFLF